MAKKMGRPSKYKPIYCKRLIKYFDIEPHYTETVTIKYKNGTEKIIKKEIANDIPTFEGFSDSIGVDESTLLRWRDKYKDFRSAYNKAKQLQKKIWIVNSMKGLYPAFYAIFFGKNVFGWKDKSEVDNKHTGNVIIKRVSYK